MIKVITNFNSRNIKFAAKENEAQAHKQTPAAYKQFDKKPVSSEVLLAQLPNVKMPSKGQNYCVFDEKKVKAYVQRGQEAIPELKQILQTSKDEKQIVETLYILDRMIDSGVKDIDKLYPVLSNFNDTDSPNIQVFLAGIYRKTQVPDAFGPLIKMLIKDSNKPTVQKTADTAKDTNSNQKTQTFDPTEEVGGAILEYIRNYSNMPKKPEQK